jgi:hypothetical protein
MQAIDWDAPCMFTLLLMEKGYTLHVHTAGGGKGDTLQVHIAWQWKETHPAHPYYWQWKGYTLHVHSAEVGKLYTCRFMYIYYYITSHQRSSLPLPVYIYVQTIPR